MLGKIAVGYKIELPSARPRILSHVMEAEFEENLRVWVVEVAVPKGPQELWESRGDVVCSGRC